MILIYRPTEGGRLSRPKHCSKGAQAAQPVPKVRRANYLTTATYSDRPMYLSCNTDRQKTASESRKCVATFSLVRGGRSRGGRSAAV